MILRMYAVLDVKAEAFKPPFCFRSDAEAQRVFFRALQDPQTQLSDYPADYRLWFVGSFDDNTGNIHDLEPKEIASGVALPKED